MDIFQDPAALINNAVSGGSATAGSGGTTTQNQTDSTGGFNWNGIWGFGSDVAKIWQPRPVVVNGQAVQGQSNTGLIIGLSVAALAVIGLIVFALKS
jgi:hypothetical protein